MSVDSCYVTVPDQTDPHTIAIHCDTSGYIDGTPCVCEVIGDDNWQSRQLPFVSGNAIDCTCSGMPYQHYSIKVHAVDEPNNGTARYGTLSLREGWVDD